MEYNNKKVNHRKQMVINEYLKVFRGDVFSEAISEAGEISPYIGDLLEINSSESPYELSAKMFNVFSDKFPSLVDNEHMQWSLTVSANRSKIKTDNKISFGWIIKYKHNNRTKENSIETVTITFTEFAEIGKETDLHKALMDCNYEMKEKKN